MDNPKKGDKVACDKPNGLRPYTGVITEVFFGYVKVKLDKPQGPNNIHAIAMTAPKNLRLIEEPKVEVEKVEESLIPLEEPQQSETPPVETPSVEEQNGDHTE